MSELPEAVSEVWTNPRSLQLLLWVQAIWTLFSQEVTLLHRKPTGGWATSFKTHTPTTTASSLPEVVGKSGAVNKRARCIQLPTDELKEDTTRSLVFLIFTHHQPSSYSTYTYLQYIHTLTMHTHASYGNSGHIWSLLGGQFAHIRAGFTASKHPRTSLGSFGSFKLPPCSQILLYIKKI